MTELSDPVTFSQRLSDADLHVTPAAQAKLGELIREAEDGAEAVRIFVAGGGCGGMTYGMTYADRVTPYDAVFEGNGFKAYVDAAALNFLRGCQIDFRDDTFVFNNVFRSVGGSGTCGGCGSASRGGY